MIELSAVTQQDLQSYCLDVARQAKAASRRLSGLSTAVKNDWLRRCADALESSVDQILSRNALDLEAAPKYGLTDASIDRLRLDSPRISGIAGALREIAMLPDPVGETLEGSIRPSGLDIRKVRVPLGTVFFIYESRPNVTVDAAAICVKSGNAVILRGGKEAKHSAAVLVEIMKRCSQEVGIPSEAVQIVRTTDRAAVGHFLALDEFIDVAIPRGGKGLISRVASEARMPVIKHYDGNCHVYIDESADPQMAQDIVVNSKCQRMGVCNACESLLVHKACAAKLVPLIAQQLEDRSVEIRGDEAFCHLWEDATPATPQDWSEEYLGPIISAKVVDSLEEAVEHINQYGSHHTDAIVTQNLNAARLFTRDVDSSAVVVNASTRFNDGGEFGLGAEIGISTDKFHARGPCGLNELTTYKYCVLGTGQIRQ